MDITDDGKSDFEEELLHMIRTKLSAAQGLEYEELVAMLKDQVEADETAGTRAQDNRPDESSVITMRSSQHGGYTPAPNSGASIVWR